MGFSEVTPQTRGRKKPDSLHALQDQVQEAQENLSVDDFINLKPQQQTAYLYKLSRQKEEHKNVKDEYLGKMVWMNKKVQESGLKLVVKLKEEIEKKKKQNNNSEKINQAFSAIHAFVIENSIVWTGKQEVPIYNTDEMADISDAMIRVRDGREIYNKDDINYFLRNSGKLLENFTQKAKEVKEKQLSELATIKKIYDLVAKEIPSYKWLGEGDNQYQTFEELLENKAGICTEKNALLIHALRICDIEAYLWGGGGHINTRIFTSEGILDIDVTGSEPFRLSQLTHKANYVFNLAETNLSGMPDVVKKFARKKANGHYRVEMDLDTDEAIAFIAKNNGITIDQLKEIINIYAEIKPHPLYTLGSEITPKNAEKYKKDLFPRVLQ